MLCSFVYPPAGHRYFSFLSTLSRSSLLTRTAIPIDWAVAGANCQPANPVCKLVPTPDDRGPQDRTKMAPATWGLRNQVSNFIFLVPLLTLSYVFRFGHLSPGIRFVVSRAVGQGIRPTGVGWGWEGGDVVSDWKNRKSRFASLLEQ